MRIYSEILNCVAFIGYGRDGSFTPVATGFFVYWPGGNDSIAGTYLVTAAHVASSLGKDPFEIRINGKETDSIVKHIDQASWHHHPDADVDVAILLFEIPENSCAITISAGMAADEFVDSGIIDVGDTTYVVGLFNRLPGKRRNQPIVHTGHIAMLPGEEPIRVQNSDQKISAVKGYLIEAQALSGASGAPVFVRESTATTIKPIPSDKYPAYTDFMHYGLVAGPLKLLGIWQASWEGDPSEQVSSDRDLKSAKITLGLGIVVPADRMREVMLSEPAILERRERLISL